VGALIIYMAHEYDLFGRMAALPQGRHLREESRSMVSEDKEAAPGPAISDPSINRRETVPDEPLLASSTSIPPDMRRNIGVLLSRNARYLREDLGVALEPLQLSVHEYAIMRIVEGGQAESQQAVAARYGIDRSTMVEIADKLEARQLLSRIKNPQDRRSYNLLLTAKGRKTLTRAKRIAEAFYKKFLEPLSESEAVMLYESLAKLIAARDS
jgi:DNA-binding MarR family transcriptional regulator